MWGRGQRNKVVKYGGRAWGALNFFFWWLCATRVSKCRDLGSGFSLKYGGLGNENLEKFGFRDFVHKMAENTINFLKIENGGHKSGALTVN